MKRTLLSVSRLLGLLTGLFSLTMLNISAGRTARTEDGHACIQAADKERAAQLVARMTLDEKILLISGDKENSFWTAGIPRLGIPAIQTADGPQGIRRKTKSTLYPSGIATAASWNKDLARSIGEGIAQDAKARGAAILLGPGTNIYRSALCGRNFEYYGEDPFLSGELAVSYIQGMQEQGVIATVKHFACNNQEYNRYGVNVSADERTLNEIYFPAFKKAVQEGNVAAVMTSYNPLNGAHTPENAWLIKNNLRKWGFEGIVMSDWGSCYDVLAFMLSGIDLEMPDAFASRPEKVKPLIENGVVPMRELDEKCLHILQVYSAFGLLDKDITDKSIPEDSEENNRRAYEAALEAPVLLKNEGGLLPLKAGSKIVVIGPNADIVPLGGGSGAVTPPDGRGVTLRAGLEQLDGYQVTYLEKAEADILKNADIVIASIGFHRTYEHEGEDRTYRLPEGQDELMAQLLEYNPHVVAVVNSGGEFDATAWMDKVPAVLLAWYDGQCGGKALAEILSGKVSPSGKLPFTFWGTLEKNPASGHYYPEPSPYKGAEHYRDPFQFSDYAEGVFLGYRGVEHFGVKPLYPFGYGLSYSSFSYSDLVVVPKKDGLDVCFTLTNSGSMEAAEAAQVYVAPKEPSLPRPVHELKGFTKVRLAPGKSATVVVHLDGEAFAHYDIYSHAWVTDPGTYEIQVAASSDDIRLRADCKRMPRRF